MMLQEYGTKNNIRVISSNMELANKDGEIVPLEELFHNSPNTVWDGSPYKYRLMNSERYIADIVFEFIEPPNATISSLYFNKPDLAITTKYYDEEGVEIHPMDQDPNRRIKTVKISQSSFAHAVNVFNTIDRIFISFREKTSYVIDAGDVYIGKQNSIISKSLDNDFVMRTLGISGTEEFQIRSLYENSAVRISPEIPEENMKKVLGEFNKISMKEGFSV